MKKQLWQALSSTLFILGAGSALAIPFSSIDPRSMAMGGAGVAVASPATAPAFNPSLLAASKADDDFAMEFPIVGFRVYDPDDFIGALDDFQANDYIGELGNAISAANTASAAATNFAQLIATASKYVDLATATNNLNDGLQTMNKGLRGELGGAAVISIPSKNFGMAVILNGSINSGFELRYTDELVLGNLSADMSQYASCLGSANPLSANCTATYNYVDPLTGQVNFNTNTNITSSVFINSVLMIEAGISFASEVQLGGDDIAIGVTPKIVSVTAVTYDTGVAIANTNNFDAGSNPTTNDFNIDVGMAKDFGDGWRFGLAIKNLIPKEYELYANGVASGQYVKINPMARIGLSHQTEFSTVAIDLDLTENEPVATEPTSRLFCIGVEVNGWDVAQLRAGYRTDLNDSERGVASVGAGLSPFGAHVDIALVGGNSQEIGLAGQLGFRF